MDSPGHSIWSVHYFSLRKKHLYFILLRTPVGINRVCPIWRSRLPEKEPWLNDTYYNDPDIKPRTSLMPQQLMKFAWQIADGMSYLSTRSVS